MNTYWMLEEREPEGKSLAVIGKSPNLESEIPFGNNWFGGKPLEIQISEPLVFQLDPHGGNDLADFFPPSIPLMSVKMLNALTKAGVDTIESFPAVLLDKSGNPVPEEFRAVNITSRIACADLDASDCFVDDPDNLVGIDFDSLVIDETKTQGALFFRLHEAVNGIVVHDSVRQMLEPLELMGIVFIKPEDWIG